MVEEFKTYITVVETNSFTKAAERLHLSQPSVSIHIKRLEEHFGTTLIKRSNKDKALYITTTGNYLYRKAKECLQLLEDINMGIQQMEEVVIGKVKIGASLTVGECILPGFLNELTLKYPEIEYEVVIGNTEEICQKVRQLEIDMGVVEGKVNSTGFIQEVFYEDEMVLVRKPSVETPPVFDRKLLQKERWVSREEGSGTCESLQKLLSQYKIKPKHMTRMGSNYAVKESVIHGLGVTLISKTFIEKDVEAGALEIIPLPEPIHRQMHYIIEKDVRLNALKRRMVDELEAYKNF